MSSASIARFADATNWNLEQCYENLPRDLKRKKSKEPTRLPIKTASGIIQRVEAPPSPDASENESEGEEDGCSGIQEEVEELEPEKPKIPERQRIREAKEELARIAGMLQEDPEENIGMLKGLREICDDEHPTIRQLALATQLAVYKDLIPGYRIRPLTDEEQKTKVSKDVKKLRGFEQSLVANYQSYVERLAELSRAARSDRSTPSTVAVGKTAVNCATGLLLHVPHFNFRGELIKMLVERISVKTVDHGFVTARAAFENLFRDDDDGRPSLEAVQLLTKMMRAKKFNVNESVLNTFLQLRLLTELNIHEDDEGPEKKKQKKKDREHRTKKQRKFQKEKKVIDKEMREADATVSYEERERNQGETLKLVFATYIRILKERPPGLMAATLEGLAKYAHLINADFFGDILVSLRELISEAEEELEETDADDETTRNATREALLCIITAFALLYGQGESMVSTDLTFFTSHLYATLPALALSAGLEDSYKSLRLPDPLSSVVTSSGRVNVATEIEMLIRALDALLFKQNAITNPVRLAAFTKRLLTCSLNMPEKCTLAMLGVMNKLAKKHQRKLASLFSSEDTVGDGVYKGDVDEPELSNPFAATIWETELLRKHYSPKVAEAAKGLGKGFLGKEKKR